MANNIKGPTGNSAALVSAGAAHTCAVLTTSNIMCWGRNNYGQLGIGLTIDSDVPVLIKEPAYLSGAPFLLL